MYRRHERGIGLLYTPYAGSWLNMAESVQRIIIRQALEGHHVYDEEQSRVIYLVIISIFGKLPHNFSGYPQICEARSESHY